MSDEKDTSSNSAWHGGKGSITRKGSNQKAYSDNWEKIFGKKDLPSAVDDAATVMDESAAKRKSDKDGRQK